MANIRKHVGVQRVIHRKHRVSAIDQRLELRLAVIDTARHLARLPDGALVGGPLGQNLEQVGFSHTVLRQRDVGLALFCKTKTVTKMNN
jgi:hypothetical protein